MLTNYRLATNPKDICIIELIYILLCIFRRHWWCIVDLNTTSLLLLAIVVWQFPAALIFWSAQPQPHQVSPRCRWCVILVRCSGMENVIVG